MFDPSDTFYIRHRMFCFCKSDEFDRLYDGRLEIKRLTKEMCDAIGEPQLFMLYEGYVFLVPALEASDVFLNGGVFING